MSDLSASQELSARVRVMQILAGALAAGSLIFAIIAIFVRQGGAFQPPAMPIVTYVMLGIAALDLIAFFVVPKLLVAGMRNRVTAGTMQLPMPQSTTVGELSEEERMHCALYQTQLIIRAAMLEGIVFAFLIAFMIEGESLAAVMAAVFWVGLVLLFPTRDRVERWIERQRTGSA